MEAEIFINKAGLSNTDSLLVKGRSYDSFELSHKGLMRCKLCKQEMWQVTF